MLPIIAPTEAIKRPADDGDYIVDFYWQGSPVFEWIKIAIEDNTCETLRSLRFPRKA